MDVMEPFLQAVAQVGFPIAVAGYLLLRQEKTLKENADRVDARLDAIEKSLTDENGIGARIDKLKYSINALSKGLKKYVH